MLRHQTDTSLQTEHNVFHLSVRVLGVFVTRLHDPERATGFVVSAEIHLSSLGLNLKGLMS